jgi:hypothetical protein
MKTLCFILGFASACLSAQAQNLLKNPSFEVVGASPDAAADWNRWGDWINRETGWSPTHGGACLIGYHHWQITNAQNSGIWQDVTTVQAGQKFTFTVFVSADVPDAGNNSADKIELRLEAIRDGHELTIASATTPIEDLQQTPGWHELSVTGTTPENNIRALVVVTPSSGGPRGGAVKIDDADLELAK